MIAGWMVAENSLDIIIISSKLLLGFWGAFNGECDISWIEYVPVSFTICNFATRPPNIRLHRHDQSVVRSVSTEETIKSFNLRLWPTPNTISAGTDHFSDRDSKYFSVLSEETMAVQLRCTFEIKM